MASEKTCYWAAVAVLALMVGNSIATRHQDFIRSLNDRALVATRQLSADSARYAAFAEVMFGRASTRFARSETAVACAQTRFASMQNVLARHEVAFARIEGQRARLAAIEQMSVRMSCPRPAVRVQIAQPRIVLNPGTI